MAILKVCRNQYPDAKRRGCLTFRTNKNMLSKLAIQLIHETEEKPCTIL